VGTTILAMQTAVVLKWWSRQHGRVGEWWVGESRN
jgi:hypothetical protein